MRPRISTPKNDASIAKAVKLSQPSSGPCIGPARRDGSLQLVPNWKAMTMPDATPRPKAMPKMRSQKENSRSYTGAFRISAHAWR